MKRYNKIMEVFWLVTAILTSVIAAYVIGKKGLADNYHFLFFPLIAGFLFGMRRFMRMRMEKHDAADSSSEERVDGADEE